MTWEQVSNKLDTLLSAYEGGFDLDEYEKSVFFNKAHRDLVREYYLGINPTMKSFDSSEEGSAYLRPYMKSASKEITQEETVITLASEVWYITMEYIEAGGKKYPVIPVLHDEYSKVVNNPFRNKSTKKRALRFINSDGANCIIAWSGETGKEVKYHYFYISEPPYLGIEIEKDIVDNSSTNVDIHSSFLEIIIQRTLELIAQSRAQEKNQNV